MEPSHGPTSAGKIKAHNLHLLIGNEAPQDYPNNRPGGDNIRQGSAGSHSSEDSRKMDQSPTGNHSDDSLEAEMKYQEDLKERLRSSFAELGMNPEGVLQDSLDDDEDDPGLRDSLEDLPPNPIKREGTFVKDDDNELQDSLEATQDNNNKFHENLPLQDSLDATKPIPPGNPDEPTAEEIQGYDRTIDDHMITYPATGPTLTSTRQSSGNSHHSNRSNSKPNSRKNSADSGKNSPKVSTLKRLKDNPNHGKLPPRLPNGLQQERRNSSPRISRQNSPSVGSAGSRRRSSSQPRPVPIPGINTHSRDNTPAKKVRERTRPNLGSKTHSKIHRLESGKEVHVEYISDDSGDEMHFVDEKGSPVDNFGLPLNDTINGGDMPKQYRIMKKPAPPKGPSPLEQQTVNARRVSSGGLKGHQPINEMTNGQVVEPIIQPTQNQHVGIEDSTLPPDDKPAVFGDVRVQSNDERNSAGKESDRYNDLKFNMDAVKQAAAEQEAALLSRDSSGSKVRRVPSGNKNNNGNTPEEEQSRHMEYSSQQNPGDQYEQPQQTEKPQNVRQPAENKYHTPESAYSQRSNVQPQYEDTGADPRERQFRNQGQSWQGSASSSVRQFGYGGPGAPPVPHAQPIHGGAPQLQQLQSPPAVAPNQYFDYQQQQQQFNQSIDYSQPMQYDYDPNIPGNYNQAMPPSSGYQQPVQSGFEPNVANSFQPNMQFGQPIQPTQQWQYQQQGFQQQPQFQPQFIQQQPPSQPQTAIYGGVPQGSIQGPVNFNPGGFNQQAIPLQQQQQFYDQYNQPSAPYVDQNNFNEFQGNVPPPQGNYPSLQGNVPLMQTNVPTSVQQPFDNSQITNINPHPLRQPPPRRIQQGPHHQPIRQPMRAGPDFISKNKTLRFGPPKRTYGQLYTMKRDTTTQTPSPLNPNMPLPSISRENSQDINPYRDVAGDDDAWTKQLVEEQKQMAQLMRGQSESNLQDMPNPRNSHTQASWSADHATAYARMQASQPQQSMISPRAAKVAFSDDVYNSFESEDLRESWSLPSNSKRTSPYPLLPGIPQKKNTERQSPLRTSDPDGYLVKMQKAKQGPQYKEYTMRDYRNLKKDMKLGGLGPDVEIIAERQDKVNRQRSYAKSVMEQNRKVLHQAKRKPVVAKKAPTPNGNESPSRRNVAIQYAKNIPKPRIPTPPEQVHERLYGALSRQQQEQQEHQEAVAEEMARLEELKARHMKEKEQVEKLRTEIPIT